MKKLKQDSFNEKEKDSIDKLLEEQLIEKRIYTEQQIKEMVTLDIIKRMVELVKGFEFKIGNNQIWFGDMGILSGYFTDWIFFPLLIHRAVDGFNKIHNGFFEQIVIYSNAIVYNKVESKEFKDYQPENLTQCELALLHCLIEILKEEV